MNMYAGKNGHKDWIHEVLIQWFQTLTPSEKKARLKKTDKETARLLILSDLDTYKKRRK
jgi:hypothetical protein